MVAKSSRKAAKKKAKKATKKAAKKPAKKSSKKRAAKSSKAKATPRATKSAQVAAGSITVVPYDGPDAEDKITCRTKSALSLIPGIFKRLDTDNDPKDGKPRFTFVLADANAIFFNVPNCNPDGFFYIPERSQNIASIGGPEYLGTGPIRAVRIKIFIKNFLQIGFTLAFRIRFEENYNVTNQFNPKRRSASIQVL